MPYYLYLRSSQPQGNILRTESHLQNAEIEETPPQSVQVCIVTFSIDLPEKVLSYLAIAPNLSDFSLDISCNRRISFGDLVNIGNKIKAVRRI